MDGKTGQWTKELDGCNTKQKQGSQVGRKMVANQRGKEAWKMTKRVSEKCPKGLKMGVKEDSQLRKKLVAKFWQIGQPNKGKYGCKQKEKEGSEEWRKREKKSKGKQIKQRRKNMSKKGKRVRAKEANWKEERRDGLKRTKREKKKKEGWIL